MFCAVYLPPTIFFFALVVSWHYYCDLISFIGLHVASNGGNVAVD
jgi:hypothetical protein